tara:strand:+ start:1117 stop:1299 length:183 start_codon:yes stop_codon:yes gene_type:complete
MTDNIRKMINTGAFVPINVKQIAKAYYRERLQIHGESMKAYEDVGRKFGRSIMWVRRAIK